MEPAMTEKLLQVLDGTSNSTVILQVMVIPCNATQDIAGASNMRCSITGG
jgi:hypothetical protein